MNSSGVPFILAVSTRIKPLVVLEDSLCNVFSFTAGTLSIAVVMFTRAVSAAYSFRVLFISHSGAGTGGTSARGTAISGHSLWTPFI